MYKETETETESRMVKRIKQQQQSLRRYDPDQVIRVSSQPASERMELVHGWHSAPLADDSVSVCIQSLRTRSQTQTNGQSARDATEGVPERLDDRRLICRRHCTRVDECERVAAWWVVWTTAEGERTRRVYATPGTSFGSNWMGGARRSNDSERIADAVDAQPT